MAAGRHEEADKRLREALDLAKAAGRVLHPSIAWDYQIISMNLRNWGKLEESARFLDSAPKFEELRTDGATKDDRAKFLEWERAALQLDLGHAEAAIGILEAHPPEGSDWDAIMKYNGIMAIGLCQLHRWNEGLTFLKKVQQTLEANGELQNSRDYGWLWSTMGLCALDAGDRAGARAYTAKTRAVFTAQANPAPFLKERLQQLDRRLGNRIVTSKG
jgi:tetratricopeptide (TPR) repeat protein